MKNVFLLLLAAVCVYQYMNPRVEVQVREVRVETARLAPPKLYFHSPLDAPAMSTSASTGTGYLSTEPFSRFGPSLLNTNYRRSSGGYTPSRLPTPNADSTNPLASVEALQSKLNEQP